MVIIISCEGHRVNAVNENAPKDAPARVRVGIERLFVTEWSFAT
jgi:hypothetical protein